ncbi:GL26318 [Drosophila persimilis]|uniref:GL26318 n=1 Tax=Drosophila persimilis TaxID=7234 RepID=B4GS78_DROPE|nr:GL26318 [Drosophila persimilis]
MCNFFDQLGRINNGICCTDMDANTFGVFPLPTTTTTERPSPAADEGENGDEPEEEPVNVDTVVQPAETPHPEDPIDNVNSVEDTPDFQDVNTIEANAPEPEPEAEPELERYQCPPSPPTPVYPYQWPFGSFAGAQ